MDRLKYSFRQEAGSGTLDLYIYSEVCADYYDVDENWNLVKVQSETSADYFRRQLEEHRNVTQINVYINSMGGSVVEGYGIYSQLKRHPAQKTAYIDGFACSIASIIACAADTVVAYPNSMMMIHEMEDGVFGNADAMREAADALDKIMEGNRQVYLAKSAGKLTEAELSEMLKAETWLTAQDCLRCGLVDEVREQGGMTGQTAAVLMEKANGALKTQLARRRMLLETAHAANATIAAPAPGAPPVDRNAPKSSGADPDEKSDPEKLKDEERTLTALFSGFGKRKTA